MSFEGKTALVTGASRGIGHAIALELSKCGAQVIGTATSEKGVDAINDALGVTGRGYVVNVADDDSVRTFFEAIEEEQSPTILVNNAGIARDNIVLRMKSDEWADVINTNLNGIYRLTRSCLRDMTKARWGRIINMTSVVGSMGNAGQSNYAAAKAGVEGFSRALAREVASRGITVNCVAPGFISTDMTSELPEDQRELLLSRIPAGRLGESAEVAALVAFLADEASGYITGETIHINGGMYMG